MKRNLEIAIKRNRRIKELPLLNEQLSNILHRPFTNSDYASIEFSVDLSGWYFQLLQNLDRSVFKRYRLEDDYVLDHLKQELLSGWTSPAYLITETTSIIGLLQADLELFATNYLALLKLDGDSIGFVTTDRSIVIHIDMFDEDGSWFLELVVVSDRAGIE